jgi:DeoR/GlpR family transcriptional regulator of sugar metabolism
VGAQPGVTSGELAKLFRVKPATLYRTVSQLHKDGKLRKEGRGLHIA